MIPACNIEQINMELERRHDYGESCVVGLMLARYNIKLTIDIINECYEYWHMWSGREFDMFWVGYGEYGYPNANNATKIKMTFPGNITNHYFDCESFIQTIKTISEHNENKWSYNDRIQVMLVNYRDGKIRLNEYIVVDLEDNLDFYKGNIRALVNDLIDKARICSDVNQIKKSMLNDKFWEQIKGIKISDIISLAASFI